MFAELDRYISSKNISDLLTYSVVSDRTPLNVSSPTLLVLKVKANAACHLSKLEIVLPLDKKSISVMGVLLETSQEESALCNIKNVGKIVVQNMDFLGLKKHIEVSLTSEGIIQITSGSEPLKLDKNMSFDVFIPIKSVSDKVGQCEILVNEFSSPVGNDFRFKQTTFSLNKFPSSFVLSGLSIDNYELYSGEKLYVSWKAQLGKRNSVDLVGHAAVSADEEVDLTLSWKNVSFDVTHIDDGTENYRQGIVLESDQSEQYNFELSATLKNNPNVVEKYTIHKPVILHLPVLETFTVSSPSMQGNEKERKVPLGDKVRLTWHTRGKVSGYTLELGDGNTVKLSSDATYYDDEPRNSKIYKLTPLLSNGDSLPTKSAKMVLFQPRHKAVKVKMDSDYVSAVHLSQDGSKLFAGSANKIIVLDTITNEVLKQIPTIGSPIKAFALSADGLTLYAGCDPSFIYVISTKDSQVLAVHDTLVSKGVQGLALAKVQQKLYLSSGNFILSFDIATNTLEKFDVKKNVGALKINKWGNKLYIASKGKEKEIYLFNTIANRIEDLPMVLPDSNDFSYLKDLALTPDENFLYVVSSDGQVRKINPVTREIDPHPAFEKCRNPESLLSFELKVGDEEASECLYVADGFNNSVLYVNPRSLSNPQKSEKINVGINPHHLVLSEDGLRIYVVCSNGVYSFATREISCAFLNNTKKSSDILHSENDSLSQKKLPESAAQKDGEGRAADDFIAKMNDPVAKQRTAERQMAEVDKTLAQGPFGIFFPSNGRQELRKGTPFNLFLPGYAQVDATPDKAGEEKTENGKDKNGGVDSQGKLSSPNKMDSPRSPLSLPPKDKGEADGSESHTAAASRASSHGMQQQKQAPAVVAKKEMKEVEGVLQSGTASEPRSDSSSRSKKLSVLRELGQRLGRK